MRSNAHIPAPRECCLFLDVDGTLLDFAPTPDAVEVDESLRDLLRNLDFACEGAIALMSGRTIVDIDELFEPLYLAAAGVHGCERRDAQGHWRLPACRGPSLSEFREPLLAAVRPLSGVLVEDKGCAIALHYRAAPQLEASLRENLRRIVPALPPTYELLQGNLYIEIKPSVYDTATAIEAFMKEPPFAERFPIFIGDDVIAQDGIVTVQRLQGLAIGVGNAIDADLRLADPLAVRRWLEGFLLRDRRH